MPLISRMMILRNTSTRCNADGTIEKGLTVPVHTAGCHRSLPTYQVFHQIVCQHQIEVEVWPANAEVYFRDERYTDPVNTQVRFHASVYNGMSSKVNWDVQDPAGNPGAGSIDPTGLYLAPPKGSLSHGTTDIIIATAAENPFRKAYAFVTLIGNGPEPIPHPTVEIFPRQAYLYYPQGHDNAYIDQSNTQQLFRATIRHSTGTAVEWLVDSVVQGGAGTAPWFLYQVTGSGSPKVVRVSVRLSTQPAIIDEAKVIQINYTWPGLV